MWAEEKQVEEAKATVEKEKVEVAQEQEELKKTKAAEAAKIEEEKKAEKAEVAEVEKEKNEALVKASTIPSELKRRHKCVLENKMRPSWKSQQRKTRPRRKKPLPTPQKSIFSFSNFGSFLSIRMHSNLDPLIFNSVRLVKIYAKEIFFQKLHFVAVLQLF